MQEQPKNVRKIIFWILVVILAVLFLLIWIESIKTRIEATKEGNLWEQFKPPEVENIPKVETPQFPEFTEEELKMLEEALQKEIEEGTPTPTPENP